MAFFGEKDGGIPHGIFLNDIQDMKVRNITRLDGAAYAHVCPLCGAELASASEPGLLPSYSVCRCDLLEDGSPRFLLERSKEEVGGMVLTDRKDLIVIRFKERAFNDTQRVTFLSDETERRPDAREIARALRLMGGWLVLRHRSAATDEPHGMELDEDGRTVVYRGKFPRWRLTVADGGATAGQIGSSMAKAAAFLRSQERRRGGLDG